MAHAPRRRIASTMLVFSALVLPALAALQSGNSRPFLKAVDPNGNPTTENGSLGFGKIYYETNTNILVRIGGGVVSNRFGGPVVFNNQGGSLKNPFDGQTYPITSDQQFALLPILGRSAATIVQIFDPREI